MAAAAVTRPVRGISTWRPRREAQEGPVACPPRLVAPKMRLAALLACAAALALRTTASLELRPLAGRFGLAAHGIVRGELNNATTRHALRAAFAASRGLLLVRGLEGLTREELVELSAIFGDVEFGPADGDYEKIVEGDARVHEF